MQAAVHIRQLEIRRDERADKRVLLLGPRAEIPYFFFMGDRLPQQPREFAHIEPRGCPLFGEKSRTARFRNRETEFVAADALRFDHHQREFNTTFGDAWKTKLSSAGLVYKLARL